MSYIRAGHPLKHVDGVSNDYVFPTTNPDTNEHYIEDYGGISDDGFIELLFKRWHTNDIIFKEHLLKRLAKRLNVTLRNRPLTSQEEDIITKKLLEEFEKNNSEFYMNGCCKNTIKKLRYLEDSSVLCNCGKYWTKEEFKKVKKWV